MENLMAIISEQMIVPTWEILTLLAIVSICLLLRAARLGLLLTYIFTLHLTWSVVSLHLTVLNLAIFVILGGIVLILGFIAMINDYYG